MSNPLFDVPPPVLDATAAKVQQMLIDKLRDERGVHIEDAISGAAALGGVTLLRSTGVPLDTLEPGSAVLGTGVDDVGEHYIGFMAAVCDMMDLDPRGGWGDPVPAENKPHRSVLELTQLLEPAFVALCDEDSVPPAARARVGVFTAIRILGVGRQAIEQSIGKALALESFVAGAKTVPHPLP